MLEVKLINSAVAVDTKDGETFVIDLNQDFDFRDSMEHSLLCINQEHHNGVIIPDVPTHLDYKVTSSHSIYFRYMDIDLPLDLHGPISYLSVRYPTDDELK